MVLVADIEEAFHSDFWAEVSKRFGRPVPFVERVFGQRRLQCGSPRWFCSIPRFKRDAENESDSGVVRPLQLDFRHTIPFGIRLLMCVSDIDRVFLGPNAIITTIGTLAVVTIK
jgi:hypothetical protein